MPDRWCGEVVGGFVELEVAVAAFGLDMGVVRNEMSVRCAEYTTWEGSVGMKDERRFRI